MAVANVRSFDTAQRVRPFLKWAGGKSQLLDIIFSKFPQTYGRYYEPFVGGGSVFFALRPRRATLGDINRELIMTYTAIRDQLDDVLYELKQHRAEASYYYHIRNQSLDKLTSVQVAARAIFLNRTCFNGLYRVNLNGQFNVPFGSYANPVICQEAILRSASRSLKGVSLYHQDALKIAQRARLGDLVYFDPPYDPVSKTSSFTQYAKQGFRREDHERLAHCFKKLAQRGVHVVLSNSDTPFIRSLYRGMRIERVLARRRISASNTGRAAVAEVLITAE